MKINLRFADGIVTIVKSSQELELMMEALSEECKVGLEANYDKTKIMSNGPNNSIKINNLSLSIAMCI